MSVPSPTPDPFAPRPIEPAPKPPRGRTGTGPVVLLVTGALLLVATAAIAVFAGRTFVDTLPTGILGGDGQAGPAVVAEVAVPGTAAVELSEGTYTVLLRTLGGPGELDGPLHVTGPDGAELSLRPAGVSTSVSRGGAHARSVVDVRTAQAGEHVLSAPRTRDGAAASLLVIEAADSGAFLGSIFVTVAGTFVALFLGAVALGLVIGGLIWRHVRRRAVPEPAAHGRAG